MAAPPARLRRLLECRAPAVHALDQTRRLGHDAGGAAAASQTRRRPGSRADRRGRRLVLRHILTDTTGLLLAVEVTAANEQDRAVLRRLLAAAKTSCPNIAKVWADKGYTGPATRELAEQTGIDIEIVSVPKPPPASGFLVQPRRWVVERTHAWINRNRRMVRQWEWEATLEAHTGFLLLSQIAVLLRRLPGLVDRL